MTISGYALPRRGEAVLKLPVLAQILGVLDMRDNLSLFATGDAELATADRKFIVVPTGSAAPFDGKFIASVSLSGGAEAVHVFEI